MQSREKTTSPSVTPKARPLSSRRVFQVLALAHYVVARPTRAILAALSLSSCAASVIVASPTDCAGLLPDSWRKPVAGAPLPPYVAVMADWVGFADLQTAQLDKANGRTADTIDIVSRCEARAAAAQQTARPKVLGIF